MWHPSCANLKGLDELDGGESERCINVIVSKGWKCPWCFSSVYTRSKNHISVKAEQTLLSNTMAAKITDNLNSTIQSTIVETLEKLISEKENQFPQLNKGIQDLNFKVDEISGEIKSISEKNMNLFQSKTSNIFTPEAKPTQIKIVQTEVRPEFQRNLFVNTRKNI